jgi:thiosulfate dehydrogenase [quinone] large subunit
LLMNMAFLLAGTTSTNPILVILGVLMILAWKNAGYVGLDYFLLPMLGTPWKQKARTPSVEPLPPLAPVPQTMATAAR